MVVTTAMMNMPVAQRNHILITNGWAEDVDYGDRKYNSQLQTSAAFAEEHQLGVYGLCGGFGVPADQPTPTPGPVVEQPAALPVQEQEPAASSFTARPPAMHPGALYGSHPMP